MTFESKKPLIFTIKALFFILAFILNISHSSGKIKLTLDESIELARKNSHRAIAIKKDYESKLANYHSFRAGFLPQLSLGGSAPGIVRAINPIIQPDGSQLFRTQSQLFSYADLTLSQRIPFTGGELFISSGISRIDILESTQMYLWRTTPIAITLRQPLFQYNWMSWDREIEDKQYPQALRKYNEDMEDLAIQITQKFFDLYIAQMNIKNAELNLAINDTLYKLSFGRYQVGKIAENDLLQSELALENERYRYETAKLDFEEIYEDLRISLGLKSNEEIEIIPPDAPEFVTVDLQKAIAEAKQNRSDLYDMEIQTIQSEQRISQIRSANGFNATISASFGLNQSAGRFPEAYKNLLDQERLDISFQIPLFQWGKSSYAIDAALADNERTRSEIELREQNFDKDVKYLVLRFLQFQNQLNAAAKSDTIAARRFEVAKNRFLIGKIDLNSLFIAQNEKNSALSAYVQSLKSYWTSYFRLRRTTLYDFVNNKKINYN